MFATLKEVAHRIKLDAMTVYFAARDPRTPFFVRLLALSIAAYALSPIDLIPDFIPILGYLDDLLILPLGIALVIKLTPATVIESSRRKAGEVAARPSSTAAAIVIVAIWVLFTLGFGYWLFTVFDT
ncbi:MAG: YkvA family protein [Arenimonas sp.]